MQRNVDALLSGTLEASTKNSSTYMHYALQKSACLPKSACSHVSRSEAESCLHHKDVVFVGDSRLRYLYAGLTALLAENSSQLEGQPPHRACPYGNVAYTRHSKECASWYQMASGAWFQNNTLQVGTTRIYYWPNAMARAFLDGRAREALPRRYGGRQDVGVRLLLANVGAYTAYATEYPYSHARGAYKKETTEDFHQFYRAVASAVPAEYKVAVAYPSACVRTRGNTNAVALPVQLKTSLVKEGWVVFEPASLTGRIWWRDRSGTIRAYGRVWNEHLQPLSVLVSSPKWDQCENMHTYDTLTDMEIQVIMRALCNTVNAK
mmetsp:Transcript_33837/g.55877  ORF Transcript_33837/g.55877 Transcript_33837/m.55877 type:complete len:321 (-) Transcript_33837:121-1083(-)|eukprot:CAMPEP_0119326164 /NCGR_PEP_ID=MMETSP1333-20130426/67692_1 /TAXON_ID=418940 /ORGANISM="Scyphosphaera apsteinii, Strain RCC1455" /LENGTH=320 /DNA_ID=CAMNT_0007334391 /DNA_START=35 /DNA_END=997 /DNA_ORIENTATION=+